MTPEHKAQDPSPGDGTQEEAQVRRLLAAAAAATPTAPVPPEVVGRLEDVLAALHAEDPTEPAAQHPVAQHPADQLAHRRRRRWPQVLAAAAALAVVGAGIGTIGGIVDGGLVGSGGSSTTSATDRAESSAGGQAGVGASPTVPKEARTFQGPDGDGQTQAPGRQLLVGRPTSRLPRMHLASARADAQRIYQRVVLGGRGNGGSSAPNTTSTPGTGCSLPPVSAGETLVAVRFGARRASLVIGSPHAGRRDADVYTCADPGTPVLATTVKVP